MGLFHSAVLELIARDNITVKDSQHYEELYVKYRDEIFLEKYGKTFLEWKKNPVEDVVTLTIGFPLRIRITATQQIHTVNTYEELRNLVGTEPFDFLGG